MRTSGAIGRQWAEFCAHTYYTRSWRPKHSQEEPEPVEENRGWSEKTGRCQRSWSTDRLTLEADGGTLQEGRVQRDPLPWDSVKFPVT